MVKENKLDSDTVLNLVICIIDLQNPNLIIEVNASRQIMVFNLSFSLVYRLSDCYVMHPLM